jgi:hypothetical protein
MSKTRIGDQTAFVGLWMSVIGLSLIYWEACRLAHGAAAINLRDSALWMLEIWSGWLIMSLPAREYCRRWRSTVGGLPWYRALGLMATLSILAMCSEWLLNALLAELGGIERWDSAWALFNSRAAFCIVVSGVIVLLSAPSLAFRRQLGDSSSSSARAAHDVADDSTLTVITRDGSLSVSLRDVEAIIAAENYVQICMACGKRYLHRTTLTNISRQLDPGRMVRVHRSSIVNAAHVRDRLPGWRLQLTSGQIVRIGRSFRATSAKCRTS